MTSTKEMKLETFCPFCNNILEISIPVDVKLTKKKKELEEK